MRRFLQISAVFALVLVVGGSWLVSNAPLAAQGPVDELPPQDAFMIGDMRPDAPELAARGDYAVGVRTLELVNPGQIDVVNNTAENPDPLYDRPLTVEVWYPALLPEGVEARATYTGYLGRSDQPDRPPRSFTFEGRALREAEPNGEGGPYPLVIVSHGFPGTRTMMTYLTENLASKGYIVVSIDHTDSHPTDVRSFASTLLNRSLDVEFMIDAMADLGAAESDSFLAGMVDAGRTGLVGYSMGGYGVLNVAGAGYSPAVMGFYGSMSAGSTAIQQRIHGDPAYTGGQDPRVKAVVAFAPWGMSYNLWSADGLAGVEIPTLLVVGSQDDVAGYENGVRRIFEGLVNSPHYLLTYENARHNVAVNPPVRQDVPLSDYMTFGEPAWDLHRINNINQHFLTAFFGTYLLDQPDEYAPYLDLIPVAAEGVHALGDDGQPTDEHTYWRGFGPRTALGLRFEQAAP